MDTIKLLIQTPIFVISQREKFWPTFEPIDSQNPEEIIRFLDKYKGVRKFIRNPAVALRQQGLVYPNIEIYETYKKPRGYQLNLKPQFSYPKLLQQHSFEEKGEEAFPEALQLLKERLYDLGIWVSIDTLKYAAVTTIHYCMNILFPSEALARHFLSCLNKMTMGERYENNDRDYANDGKAARFYTKTFDWVAYLKYYDVIENGKNQISKRATLKEREIVKKLLTEKAIPPLVRIEIRFNGKVSIRKHFRTIFGEDKETWTFEEVCKNIRSRKVMAYYWNKLMNNPLNMAILCRPTREALYRKLQGEFENKVPSATLFKAIGMFEEMQTLGIKELRASVEKKHSRTTWYNQQKEIATFIEQNINTFDTTIKDIVDKAISLEPRQLGLPI